jgi:hypothetical protein
VKYCVSADSREESIICLKTARKWSFFFYAVILALFAFGVKERGAYETE